MNLFKAMILGTLIVIAAGCEGTDPETAPPPSKDYVNEEFDLESFVRANGEVLRYVRGAITLKFTAENKISGNVLCNFYNADLVWDEDIVRIVRLDMSNQKCEQTTPFQFQEFMSTKFGGRNLQLRSADPAFTANFRMR